MKFNGTLHHRVQQQSLCHDPYIKRINKIRDVIASNYGPECACNSLVAPAQRFLSACDLRAREKVALRESHVFHSSERTSRSHFAHRERYWIPEKSPTTYRRAPRYIPRRRYHASPLSLSFLPSLAPATYFPLNEYTDNNPYSVSLGWVVLRKPWRPCIIAS